MDNVTPANFEQAQAKQLDGCRQSFKDLVSWYRDRLEIDPKLLNDLAFLLEPENVNLLWYCTVEERAAIQAFARAAFRSTVSLYVQDKQSADDAKRGGG